MIILEHHTLEKCRCHHTDRQTDKHKSENKATVSLNGMRLSFAKSKIDHFFEGPYLELTELYLEHRSSWELEITWTEESLGLRFLDHKRSS